MTTVYIVSFTLPSIALIEYIIDMSIDVTPFAVAGDIARINCTFVIPDRLYEVPMILVQRGKTKVFADASEVLTEENHQLGDQIWIGNELTRTLTISPVYTADALFYICSARFEIFAAPEYRTEAQTLPVQSKLTNTLFQDI